MSVKLNGIHHIALKCLSTVKFEETVCFYCDVLGCSVVRRWGEGKKMAVMLDTGGSMLEIFANAPDEPPEGPYRHLAFRVDDPDACIEAVRRAGYRIKEEPYDIVIPSDPPYPARIAFCYGPLGEEIEFFSER